MTLTEAARGLGVRTATLRAQIARGRLDARRRGRDWHVSRGELRRYRDEVQLRRPSRSSGLDEVFRAVGKDFEATGEWPRTRVLQRHLVQQGFEGDLAEIGRRLHPSFGRIEKQGTASLTIRGLIRAGVREAVQDFERAMRLAIARYRDPEVPEPRLSSEDFAGGSWSALRLRRLRSVLLTNPLVIAHDGGSDDRWSYAVSDDIHLLGRARTVEGYLAAVDRQVAPGGLLDIGPRNPNWPELEARIRALGPLLERASSLDEVQDVGRRSREIVGDAIDLVTVEMTVPDAPVPLGSARKAKLDAFLEARADGESRAAFRRMVRATLELANTVTHSPRGARDEAVACAHGAVLLTRTLRELVGT